MPGLEFSLEEMETNVFYAFCSRLQPFHELPDTVLHFQPVWLPENIRKKELCD